METYRRKEAGDAELLRPLRKKDVLKAEFQLSVIKVTGIPGSVPHGSDLYVEWDRKKKGGSNSTTRVQRSDAEAIWGENALIEATLLVETPEKFAKKKLTLSLFEEALIGGKKKSTRIAKVVVNLELCTKADPSQFSLPLVMDPKYLRGAEPPVLKFNIALRKLLRLNNYLLVPADTSPQTRRGSGPPPATPRDRGKPNVQEKHAEEGKTLYFAGRMYRLQPIDDKDEASDDDDSDEEDELTRLRLQVAALEKQLAEKISLTNNQESHILNLQRQLAGARNVTDHEPRYALQQVLAENNALKERLGQPVPVVSEEELRRAVSVLTERTRTLETDAAAAEEARRESLRLRVALASIKTASGKSGALPYRWLAMLMALFVVLMLLFKR